MKRRYRKLAVLLTVGLLISSVPTYAEEITAEAQQEETSSETSDEEAVNPEEMSLSDDTGDDIEDDEEIPRPSLATVKMIPDGFNDVFVPKSVSELDVPEGAVFESSDEEIARVGSKSGIIKVLKPGVFSVKMTIGEAAVSFNYYVEKPKAIEKVVSMNYLTQVYPITQNISDNEYTVPNDYWSSDEDVAIVDEDGNVTAVGNGTAMIFTYFGKHIVKTKIVVDADENYKPVYKVAINDKVSILGDSWSAFAPDLKAYYRNDWYYNIEFHQEDMWWGGLNIDRNNSIGGSGVISEPQALNSRESDLGDNPGSIIVQLGANDVLFHCWSKDNYDMMLKNIKAAYPNALIFCGTYANISNGAFVTLNNEIKEVCANNDCILIDNDNMTLSFFTDGIHPDPSGMAALKENMQNVIRKYLPGGENDILNQKLNHSDDEKDEDADDESNDSEETPEDEEAVEVSDNSISENVTDIEG